MIISVLNQKGGVGKSSIVRSLAIEMVNAKWAVHVADMDTKQQTLFKWSERREKNKFYPFVEAALYQKPSVALRMKDSCDALLIDGKAFADEHAKEVALNSDLVVMPVGNSIDDLEPSLLLASSLVKRGVKRDHILFVVSKVPENGVREAMSTRETIQEWNFNVAQGWIPQKQGYSTAMDKGLSMTETQFKTLNKKTQAVLEQIFVAARKNASEETHG